MVHASAAACQCLLHGLPTKTTAPRFSPTLVKGSQAKCRSHEANVKAYTQQTRLSTAHHQAVRMHHCSESRGQKLRGWLGPRNNTEMRAQVQEPSRNPRDSGRQIEMNRGTSMLARSLHGSEKCMGPRAEFSNGGVSKPLSGGWNHGTALAGRLLFARRQRQRKKLNRMSTRRAFEIGRPQTRVAKSHQHETQHRLPTGPRRGGTCPPTLPPHQTAAKKPASRFDARRASGVPSERYPPVQHAPSSVEG